MDYFQYNALDLEARSFRLLRLFGGESDEQIECEIFETWLHGDGAIPFEALSYAWGNLDTPRDIKLNSKRLAITENLYVALRNLRDEDEDRILWVNAVCIDQKNEKERGHQVQQMGDIFTRAEQVIFWLGHATSDINLVMTALKRLEQRSYEGSCSSCLLSDERWPKLWSETQPIWREAIQDRQWRGLQELLRRPWFKRVWILQEVANARRAVVCAGRMVVGSRIFVLAPQLINVDPDPHCRAVLDIMPGPSRDSSWWSQRRDLYTLLQRFRHSQASDPRDMIYALLGISSNSADASGLRPDYTKSTEKVIDDAMSFLFNLPPYPFRTIDKFLSNLALLAALAFTTIAQSGNAADVLNFLEDRGYQIKTGTAELVAAAANKRFSGEVRRILGAPPGLSQFDSAITAVIQHTACEPKIWWLLLQRPDPDRWNRPDPRNRKPVNNLVTNLVMNLVVIAVVLDVGRGQDFYECLNDFDDRKIGELLRDAVARCKESGMGAGEGFMGRDGEQLTTATRRAKQIATLRSVLRSLQD